MFIVSSHSMEWKTLLNIDSAFFQVDTEFIEYLCRRIKENKFLSLE